MTELIYIYITLFICQEWPIGLIECLSTIVNLSNLRTICFSFQCRCYFAVSLDVELDDLFERAWNLLSIRLMCMDSANDEETVKLITRNVIGLKLPHHVKELHIKVMHADDAKAILRQGKHLSRVTFRTFSFFGGKNLAEKITSWLSDMKRNYRSRLDWGIIVGCECCDAVEAVYLWLDTSINKQSNIQNSHKHFKRTHHGY